ncbi:aminotransferase class I/II-fold pyridoxal phosphate-dependent enzyme [Brachybacterium sp. MASK1Z-5]|uniref:Aminotransferase class I/II-fold pyridoxal phosphate-dependent enzyme n=1 Tax=Brachybacterium halotolerans TaxID=2795215 RepID=A0ABS1B9V8_9MICO|nr:aminotransferase class I/II-fold pyridoxal phosphate-dependent enzyme [Brachybacterium halotolerans]
MVRGRGNYDLGQKVARPGPYFEGRSADGPPPRLPSVDDGEQQTVNAQDSAPTTASTAASSAAPTVGITGSTALEIADSVRGLVERGVLGAGDPLPPVRTLAEQVGVNRNTAVAAYRRLSRAGIVVAQGRAGTRIAGRARIPQEGAAPAGPLRDVASGNPAPRFIPDPSRALRAVTGRPVLYGEPVVDAGLEAWARQWMEPDVPSTRHITVTGGAVDAIERLLAQVLERDDAVGLEDPCFLASIQTVRLGGYRPVGIPVDDEGMTVDGLTAALEAGVRAIVCTPRAQNPTGASLSARRAEQLRTVLAHHPFVLVIEDDYYSMLARGPFRSIVGPGHERWALVRSVSKFLGPDLCLALVASDERTASRLALRLSPGTTWVSHLLQRIAHALLSDEDSRALIDCAAAHYADRSTRMRELLRARDLEVAEQDGMSLWVGCGVDARAVSERLMRRGWLVRTGAEFDLGADDGPTAPRAGASADQHLRITVHDLDDEEAQAFAADLSASVGEVRERA